MKPEFSAMGPSRRPGSDQRGADQGPADDWDEEDFGPGASLTSPIPDKPPALWMADLMVPFVTSSRGK
jgi:hypothetical protein